MSSTPRIAIVGAGISGAACAAELSSAGFEPTVLERAASPGGRMSSPMIRERRVDLGASYFTASDSEFAAVVSQWESDGLAREWTDSFDTYEAGVDGVGLRGKSSGPVRYCAPDGLRSLVQDVLGDQPVELHRTVERVGHNGEHPTIDGKSWDVVVLAMPDPQAARVLAPSIGADDVALLQARKAAADVSYQPVLAVAVCFRERQWPFTDGLFVNGHPVLGFIADDGRRRGDGAAVLVAHTTSEFAARHLDHPDGALDEVLAALDEVLGLIEPSAFAQVHRWTFAKPTGTHLSADHLLTASGIGLAGDSWCRSGSPRVESAWLSGTALAHEIVQQLQGQTSSMPDIAGRGH